MLLTREALVTAAESGGVPTERIAVPELAADGYVIVRGMTGWERDAWERSLVKGRGKRRDIDTENVRARLAVRCLVDDTGARIFRDDEAGVLGKLRVDVLQRIFEVAQKLSGVSDEDIDELGSPSAPVAGSAPPTK